VAWAKLRRRRTVAWVSVMLLARGDVTLTHVAENADAVLAILGV
jgi:hypothetical protein